jgi:actin-related protein 5
MTEKLANPLYTRASRSRQLIYSDLADGSVTSELLFELYNAPSITYGIDSLFAFSRQKRQEGLAISMGNNATTVIPIVGGRGILSRSKR